MTKLCINCKHFDNSGLHKFEWCCHPNVGINPVDGKVKSSLAGTQRIDFKFNTTCGSQGNWFETKYPLNPDKNNWTVQRPTPEPIKLTLWQKLKGFFK